MTDIIIFIIIVTVICIGIFAIYYFHRCNPYCSGVYCDNSDGCGGICNCGKDGQCVTGICRYNTCDGINCSDTCGCNKVPGGKCDNGKCCYALTTKNYTCGNDGCGGVTTCADGATCTLVSDDTNVDDTKANLSICVSPGSKDWTYNVLRSKGSISKNVASAEECAKWLPKSPGATLLNFPCKSEKDCPVGNSCMNGFCNRNNIYQYWSYDPTNTMGNCTKIVAGSDVCGVQKTGAISFDVLNNIGPEKAPCGVFCAIHPQCPSFGVGACCPENWIQNDTNECLNGDTVMCCLNTGDGKEQNCIKAGNPTCESVGKWWKSNLAEITNGVCGASVSGSTIAVNPSTIQSFKTPCIGLNEEDICTYTSDAGNSFTGRCKRSYNDQLLRCFPDQMCVSGSPSATQGVCTSEF